MQSELKSDNASVDRLPEGSPAPMPGIEPQFSTPRLIEDHNMSLYLREVQSLLGVAAIPDN
ncbi:MAG: hypothetical protein KDA75_04755 [Planctomycetaceae bacterium]|nr:hypothetical protein [Planctomycetaceae bacterium]